jgi:hypothetical protein
MRQLLASLVPTALLAGGCSLIYNPSNIDKPPADGSVDARIDAPPVFDANPSMLALEDVTPNIIYEGQGQGGSRPALLVIRGHHIVPDGLVVTIAPDTGLTLGAPMASMNGDFIALPITVAIDEAANTGSVPLTISVSQDGGPGVVMLDNKLSVTYLPQLTASGTINTSTLAPLYSHVNAGNVTFTGTMAATVKSVSSITFGNIAVAGGAGGANSAGGAGPGGCGGAGPADNGGCSGSEGGGTGASTGSGGGGGGGFATKGSDGAGGAKGGDAHGNAQLVNYELAPPLTSNRSGGGGGGRSSLLANAGGGGGGGGTVELSAGGDIVVGTIDAKGGAGGNASGAVTAAGGGGGGSGGVVVLRSIAGTISATAVQVDGGTAGAAVAGGGAGGAGAPGRTRADVPTGSPPAGMRRGPAFAASTPAIVTTDNPMIVMTGTTDDVVDGYLIDMDGVERFGEPMNQVFSNGMLMMTPTLLPGFNTLCFTLRPGTRGKSLADTCIEMAYLP